MYIIIDFFYDKDADGNFDDSNVEDFDDELDMLEISNLIAFSFSFNLSNHSDNQVCFLINSSYSNAILL